MFLAKGPFMSMTYVLERKMHLLKNSSKLIKLVAIAAIIITLQFVPLCKANKNVCTQTLLHGNNDALNS